MTVRPDNMMFVRPSANNLHTFTATENSCFFDICLPNYTADKHNRKITYFKDTALMEEDAAETMFSGKPELLKPAYTELAYHTTAPKLPESMVINDIDYRGTNSEGIKTFVSKPDGVSFSNLM